MATPPVELNLDATLVRSLLVEQHGDLAHLPLTQVARGWNNSIFQLGQQFSIRLPHRQLAAKLIEQEQEWLPLIAPRLPLPVPVPYRIGKLTLGYPWYWSILPWLEGNTADENIDHTRTKAKSPQTNGICEWFHRTMLEEFYRVSFRKKLYTSIEELQTDADEWIVEYNCNRPHTGKYCFGKTPMETFLDSKHLALEKIIELQFEKEEKKEVKTTTRQLFAVS